MDGDTQPADALGNEEPRTIRVFVSSTFRDMQLERDELVKRVFPRIRRLCERRGVTWSEVDLRWGVTDEQKAEGAVLPVCLAEIERTRPYFIGLLGQRYGWVPDEIPGDLGGRLGWLAEDRGRSVTEMEFVHGVLRSPGSAEHAYFYLRDPAWVETLPPHDRGTFVEETDEGRERLDRLRDRVRDSGHPVRDYADPVSLGDLVLADLTALVESRFPAEQVPDPRAHDDALQHAYLRRLVGDAVDRPEIADALDAHAAGDGPPLLVTGVPGVGASVAVAAWAARRFDTGERVVAHHVAADAASAEPARMVQRLVDALAATSVGREETGGPDEPGGPTGGAGTDDPVVLRAALGQAFASVAERTIVVIDGVELLEDIGGAPDLRWLPAAIPELVRIVLVSSGERPGAQVEHRGWPRLVVSPLSGSQRRDLSVRFLARYAKALDERHLVALTAAPNTGNARFLRIVLDELRQHGDHFTLGPTIAHLCSVADADALHDLVLARYERDFDRDRPGLTRDVFTLLWAARRGLAESELLALLGDDHLPLPQAVWAPLHLAAEQGLADRAGLLGLADPSLRRAVARRYLPTDEDRRAAHGRLATFFASRDRSDRTVDELAWHQIRAGDVRGLADTLADLALVVATHVRAAGDLRRSWAWGAAAGLDMVETYREVIDHPEQSDDRPDRSDGDGDGRGDDADGDRDGDRVGDRDGDRDADVVWAVARLLTDAGHPAEALRLHRHLVERARLEPAGRDDATGDARLRAALVNLAGAAWSQGRLDEADAVAAEAVDRCRTADDRGMLSSALSLLALARRDLGRLDEADASFAEEAELCRSLDDEFGLQVCLGNRAQLLRQIGRFDEALALLREQERICRDLADDAGIARALAGQAVVLAQFGDVAAAIDLMERHAATCREQGDRRGLVEALVNLASMSSQLGDVPAALRMATEAESVGRHLADPGLLARALAARAEALTLTGQWAEVEQVGREAELTARQAGLLPLVEVALGIVGTARREQGDVAGARVAHTEALEIATANGDPAAVAIAHTHLANVAVVEQRFDEALSHWAAAEPLLRAARVVTALVPMLANRGQVHHGHGRYAEALDDFDDATTFASDLGQHEAALQWGEVGVQLAVHLGQIERADALWTAVTAAARATGDDERLQRALGERAVLLIGRAQPVGRAGDATNVDRSLLDEAALLLDEQELICRRVGHMEGLASCVGNRAIVLRYRGDLAGSLAALDEQLRISHEAGHGQGVLFATANRGELLGLLGRVPEALEALGWARSVAAQNGIAAMVQQLDAMIAALHDRN